MARRAMRRSTKATKRSTKAKKATPARKRPRSAVKAAAPNKRRTAPAPRKRRAAPPTAKPVDAQAVVQANRKRLEKIWAQHIRHEFVTKNVEATLATMVDDASVDHVPVHTGGRGKDQLRAFYRDVFIGSWPDDLQMTTTNRVVGPDQLVEEDHLRFTHSKPMEWFLPGMPPTFKEVDIDFVVVVQFRGDKLASERIYWDHATVLRQVGYSFSRETQASAGAELA